jgi:replicative DNA helicase
VPAPSAEALLISALVNTGGVGEEVQYGISAADFNGYQDEYNWLLNYVETYGCQPTRDIFRHKFTDFILSEHSNIQSAAEMVHQSANRRRINAAMTDAQDLLHIGETAAAYQRLIDAKPKAALTKPRSLLTDTDHLDRVDRGYAIELPYPTLQRLTGGIKAGNLWYVAGRPSQGKSAHLGAFNLKSVLDGNRSLFYSLEMSEDEVRGRFHASLATHLGYHGITVNSLRDRRVDTDLYRKFIGELKERLEATGGVLDVHTPADGPVSPSVVAARCGEYDLTTIDYVGLMAADGGGHAIDDWRVMATISNSLKTIALHQNARLLCAAQINRDGETGLAPPKVKNLAQSDALGQDGDVVLTMRAKARNVATHFSIEKNRHGTSGVYFYTTFDPNSGVYEEISADRAEDLACAAEEPAIINPHPPTLRVIKDES